MIPLSCKTRCFLGISLKDTSRRWSLHYAPVNPPLEWPGGNGDNHLIFTSLCFPMNTRFHFFVAWFSDGSKSSGGVSEWTTSSSLKIRLTSLPMSRGFSFNLSVVAFLCCLVIWTFDRNFQMTGALQLYVQLINSVQELNNSYWRRSNCKCFLSCLLKKETATKSHCGQPPHS